MRLKPQWKARLFDLHHYGLFFQMSSVDAHGVVGAEGQDRDLVVTWRLRAFVSEKCQFHEHLEFLYIKLVMNARAVKPVFLNLF